MAVDTKDDIHRIIDEQLKNKIKIFLMENVKDRKDAEYERFIGIMEETFHSPHLLSVFSTETSSDIDESILYSILKAKNTKENKEDQENLSIFIFLFEKINFKSNLKVNFFRNYSASIEFSFGLE